MIKDPFCVKKRTFASTISEALHYSLDICNAIIHAAGLSFIGLGAQPPTPEWGAIISLDKNYLRDAW